jgi:uncharacterized protein (TIGR02118 family)
MIKFVYCLRRLSHLSREEFQRYWLDTHGPLVRDRAGALKIRHYVQVHTLDSEINDALRQGRGTEEPYDGVAELWWDSIDDLGTGGATPEGQQAARDLLEDERRLIDLGRSSLWIGEEHPIVGS